MNNNRSIVFDRLKKMNIKYDLIEHPAAFTIDEMDELDIENKEGVVKNLFVRDDKKNRYMLFVVQKDKKVNLKQIRKSLNCRPLTFASEDDLSEFMKLSKGSVSPFGILNDKERKVEVFLDKDFLSFDYIGVHPNDNTATVWISPQDMQLIISDHGNEVAFIEILNKEN